MIAPELLAENEEWLALNKPAGLLSIPDREGKEISLKTILQQTYGTVFTVHRLDKDTSGILLFARNEEMHRYLSGLFENRLAQKWYWGLVKGSPQPATLLMDAPLLENPARRGTMKIHAKGKPALTHYEVLEKLGPYSWMEFKLVTGRLHQIRVHMQGVGHPIACDPIYGDGQPILLSALKKNFKLSQQEESERPLLHRLALHAQRLEFSLPDGKLIQLEAPLPKDLVATLNQLRKITQKK